MTVAPLRQKLNQPRELYARILYFPAYWNSDNFIINMYFQPQLMHVSVFCIYSLGNAEKHVCWERRTSESDTLNRFLRSSGMLFRLAKPYIFHWRSIFLICFCVENSRSWAMLLCLKAENTRGYVFILEINW